MTQSDVLRYLIRKGPGRTELELARAIYGGKAYQQRVNQDYYMMAIHLLFGEFLDLSDSYRFGKG
jgi:hypothetical protein